MAVVVVVIDISEPIGLVILDRIAVSSRPQRNPVVEVVVVIVLVVVVVVVVVVAVVQ